MSEKYGSEVWVRSVVEKDGQKDGQEGGRMRRMREKNG